MYYICLKNKTNKISQPILYGHKGVYAIIVTILCLLYGQGKKVIQFVRRPKMDKIGL